MDRFAKQRWEGYKASQRRDDAIERKMAEIKFNKLLLDSYRRLQLQRYGTYNPQLIDLIRRMRALKNLPQTPLTPREVDMEIQRLQHRLNVLQNRFGKRTKPKLWSKIVSKVKRGSKGGKKGQWSARKAQLAVKEYKSRGGGYRGRKKGNNSLTKWTKQKWRTKSGRPSVMGPKATGERYLPEKAIKNLTKKEYQEATRKKRRSLRKGKQYSRMSKKTSRKVSRYRFGSGKKYKFVKIRKSKSKGKKYDAVFEDRSSGRTKTVPFGAAGMSDYTKHKDPKRKERYMSRHKKREDWDDLMSAGALSRWILWNKPSFKGSLDDYRKKLRKQGYLK